MCSFVKLLVLARLLSPHEVGVMGLSLLVVSILETVTQTGFQQALIHRKDEISSLLDSAWTTLIIRSCVLYGLLYLAAPHAAHFLEVQEATSIIRVLGLTVILRGVSNIGVVCFQKELRFDRQFTFEISATFVDFLATVSALLIIGGVWSLVVGHLAGAVVRSIASYIVHPFRPRLRLEIRKMKDLWSYGKWVSWSIFFGFLVLQGDSIIISKLLGASALGYYQLAGRIANMPTTEIAHVIGSVTFPVYARMNRESVSLQEAYTKVFQITSLISFPLTGLIFLFAHDFTKIFLGERWMDIVPILQILAVAGLLRALSATAGPVLYATGNPRLETFWQAIRLVVLLAGIILFTLEWGLEGASVAVVLSILVATVGFCWSAMKVMNANLMLFFYMLIPPMTCTALMLATYLLLRSAFVLDTLSSFILVAVLCLFSYIASALILDRLFPIRLMPLVSQAIRLFTERKLTNV